MTFGFGFGLVGDIKRDFDKFQRDLKRGVKAAAKETGAGLKADIRAQVEAAGLGTRLAKTIRDDVYPKGSKESLNAAVMVWSKAPQILYAFEHGVTIKGRGGNMLAIPTANVPSGSRGRRLTPSNWPENRYGKLQAVKTRKGTIVLVAKALRKSYSKQGDFRGYRKGYKSKKRRRENEDVVMFILVPQAHLRARLKTAPIAAKWQKEYMRLIEVNTDARKKSRRT